MFWLHAAAGNHRVAATAATVQCSLLLQMMSEDNAAEEEVVVTVPRNVTASCFDAINEFCALMSVSPVVIPEVFNKRSFHELMPEQYRAWVEQLFPSGKPQLLVYDVVETANFLQIPALVDVCCANLAALMLCRSAAEIKELLS